MVLAFGFADNNWLAGVACSITVEKKVTSTNSMHLCGQHCKKRSRTAACSCTKRSQLRRFRRLIRMPHGHSFADFLPHPTGRRPRG